MIRKLVLLSCACFTAVLLQASVATAQTVDGAGGYAWLHEENLTVPGGWFGAVGFNFTDSFGVFGQVSQHRKTIDVAGVPVKTTLTIFGGGPRISGNQRSGVTYFAQLLLGGATSKAGVEGISSSNFKESNFAVQPAAGVDIKAGGVAGVRLQVGETFIKSGGETQKEFTLFAGIVVRGG